MVRRDRNINTNRYYTFTIMKAFENFEIWWVTGAQLLYGGDAVVAVDGHSKEMVDGLNKSGNIPVKIV